MLPVADAFFFFSSFWNRLQLLLWPLLPKDTWHCVSRNLVFLQEHGTAFGLFFCAKKKKCELFFSCSYSLEAWSILSSRFCVAMEDHRQVGLETEKTFPRGNLSLIPPFSGKKDDHAGTVAQRSKLLTKNISYFVLRFIVSGWWASTAWVTSVLWAHVGSSAYLL